MVEIELEEVLVEEFFLRVILLRLMSPDEIESSSEEVLPSRCVMGGGCCVCFKCRVCCIGRRFCEL